MKLRIGTSVLFLLQARTPSTAFSSPLSSHRVRKSPFTFIARGGGGSSDSNAIGSKNNIIECKATISPEEASKIGSQKSNSNGNNGNENNDEQVGTVREKIIKAAMGAIDITGPSTFIDKFAGIPFVNTSKLQNSSPRQHRVLFVLGGPGAGKGTQSENIVSEYKCIHLSVGELLRKERQRGDESPHAELIEKCLVAGQIVPVEISLGLVRNAMDEAVSGESDEKTRPKYGQPIFLVDGFPRNYDNLSGWTNNMPNYATCIGSLVYDCPIDVLEQRILSRAETSGRSDDNLESARKRFKTFQDQTMPVVHALEEVEKMQLLDDNGGNDISKLHVHHISGEGTIEEVWDATKQAMDGYVKNDVLSANSQLLNAIEAKDITTYASLTSVEMLSISQDEDATTAATKETKVSNDVNVNKVEDAFKSYEVLDECPGDVVNHISNAQIEIPSGTKAVVSYDREIEDKATGEIKSRFRETRIWSHDSNGWICIHFIRKPLTDV